MSDDPLEKPITVTLSLGQVFALSDLIGEALEHAPALSPAARGHSTALRAAHKALKTAIRNDIHDR